jgi:uncharacterized protein (DUF2147 family)
MDWMMSIKIGVWPRRIIAFLLASFVFSVADVRTGEASSVDGTWIIRNLALRIYDCDLLVCGKIVWMKDASRRASQCGKTIIWGLQPNSLTEWSGGSILDPNDGKTYRLSATYEPDGTLRAQIFVGVPILGKTEILKRVDVQDLTEKCR